MLQRLTLAAIEHLLAVRARQGFNVVQEVALSELAPLGLNTLGEASLFEEDPAGLPCTCTKNPGWMMRAEPSWYGGGHDVPTWVWISEDLALVRLPHKPTLDFEPTHEDHAVNPWRVVDAANGDFRDHDVRK